MSSLPLRVKFMLFSLMALMGAAFLAWQGNQAANMIHDTAGLRHIVTLTKLQMRIDMMHDAIHGNVLRAMHASADERAAIQQEMEENITTAEESLKAITALQMPEKFRAPFAEIDTAYHGYIGFARDIMSDGADFQALYKSEFHPSFEALAEMQEKLQDEVNAYSEHQGESADLSADEIRKWVFYSAVLSIMLNILQAAFAYFGVFSPQRRLLKIGECLTGANSSTCEEIPYPNRHDEIGALADMLRTLRASIKSRMDLADNFERKVKHAVDILASSATEMEATARSMSTTADDSQKRLAELAAGVGGTVHNIQEASSAVGQIYSSINEISKQVTQASRVNSNAVTEANQVNGLAENLSLAAAKVNEINGIITAIAGKINLLSLNATIEAARAGEAGKGFAVVASEVKTLANQTANSASEITGHIQSIQQSSTETLSGVRGINSVIAEISNISATIASAIEEQGVGTHEIARNMKSASETAGTISTNVATAADLAKSTGEAAGQMLQAAGELSRQAEGLRSEVGGFLQNIRGTSSNAA
jgi:methyl-accepting chemotaxis protein